MASGIKLINAEVLDYSQTSNFIDGGSLYQFGRTINLNITAFIYPIVTGGTFPDEGDKFKKIDDLQKDHLEEILAKGFVDRIEIGPDTPQVIENVKILSYSFPTSPAINNKITLLRVDMSLEYYEAFDNRSFLTETDAEIYDNIDFLDPSIYAKYFESFSENFTFDVSEEYEYSYKHNFSFTLRPSSSADIDLVQKAKDLVWYVFAIKAPKVGYIDDRYKNFIRDVSERGQFNESYDSVNNSYSFNRSVSLKNSAYKESRKSKKWSAALGYSVEVNETGIVTITETGDIKGKLGLDPIETSENLYKNAYDGLIELTEKTSDIRSRCQGHLDNFIKDNPDWIPGEGEWATSDDLSGNYVSFGRNINRMAGAINYTVVFTTDPKLHKDAIFDYTITADKGQNNVTSVSESGSITPYFTNKNKDFSSSSESKIITLYKNLASAEKVLGRIKPIYDSIKDSSRASFSLSHSKNLISKDVSFDSYGVQLKYSFDYEDDKNLRDSTYIRKIEKDESYEMPVINRQAFIAPNEKITNYDAMQSSEGTKSVGISCIVKRDPARNIINTVEHANYVKAASDSVFNTLNQETEKSAFVLSDQGMAGIFNFYLKDLSYDINDKYDLSYSASLGFIDKRGVVAHRLKY
jgi:hypothetical protein